MNSHELAARSRRTAGANPVSALAVSGACVLAMAAVWMIAELIPAVHMKDAVVLHEFTTLSRPRLDSIGNFLLKLLSPSLFILWGAALIAIAVAREQRRLAVAVLAVLALAPLSAEILKPLLAHAHDSVGNVRIGPASWPSGHSTAASALAMSAVLVAPAALRVIVATAGTIFVLAVSFSLLLLAWHMPSDVVAGWLLGALWTSLAVAGVRFSERLRPSGRARPGAPEPLA